LDAAGQDGMLIRCRWNRTTSPPSRRTSTSSP
jgi:hypothetical protein